MPYIIIRGNLASYSHKYPWRVLVSGLKGKSLTMFLLTIFIWLSNCFDVGLSFFYLSTFIYVEKKRITFLGLLNALYFCLAKVLLCFIDTAQLVLLC